jgi:phasin
MTKPNYEIPAEIRDFAEKSVEQARKAFEGFAGAAQKALNSFDLTPLPLQSGAKEVSATALSHAEVNVKAAFDLAQKLVHAKDLNEVLQLQSEYMKNQLELIQQQAKELGTALTKAGPLQS